MTFPISKLMSFNKWMSRHSKIHSSMVLAHLKFIDHPKAREVEKEIKKRCGRTPGGNLRHFFIDTREYQGEEYNFINQRSIKRDEEKKVKNYIWFNRQTEFKTKESFVIHHFKILSCQEPMLAIELIAKDLCTDKTWKSRKSAYVGEVIDILFTAGLIKINRN